MITMPKGKDTTRFTLSFGGVDFCLAPSVTDGTSTRATLSVSKICDGEVLIDLDNFTGTLHINKCKAAATSDIGSVTARPPIETESAGDDNLGECGMAVGTSPPKEKTKAVSAAAAPAPAAVEDTPSPQEKSCVEENLAQNPRQRKGQQKLNFFGRKKHCKKSETNKEEQANVAPPASLKRSTVEAESIHAKRKKARQSNSSESSDKTEFKDIIEEPKHDSNAKNTNSFSIASLGQSLLSSQENDYSRDGQKKLMLSSPTDEKLNPIEKEGTVSLLNNRQAHRAPCARWGQTMTMIDHKRFIVYGGQTIENDAPKSLSDLFVYDLSQSEWTKPMNCEGVARTWHTANFLPERQLLLCFGGEIPNEKTGKLTTTDQVMVLDCEIMLWYPPTVSGQVPSGRSGHASCVLPTKELVVFGGVKNGRFLNSASILDTNRWRWTTLKAFGDAPPPRSYHSATAIGSDGHTNVGTGHRIVIFGGNNGSKCFNGVHVLEATGEGRKWVWTNPKCKGEAPSPRTGHNATLLNDCSTILIYGGWDPNNEDESGDDKIFGDSFLLNTKTWTWKRGPKPRYEKSRNKAPNGGAERAGHSAVLAPGADGVQVLAFGGRLPESKLAGDFQSLTAPL